MSLRHEYINQYRWRSWESVYKLLPDLSGQKVLDMGCGIGDQAKDFIKRGALMIGVDMNEDLIKEARSRCQNNARFIHSDFRKPLKLSEPVDGLWCSFAVAYMPDFNSVLETWKRYIKKGGWIALTEIDNFFGHSPLSDSTKLLLEEYAQEAYRKGRYDFYMGHKLEKHLRKNGFRIKKTIILEDLEFSFSGPASKGVITAWQKRFDRMRLLQEFCGSGYDEVRNEFLSSLQKEKHRSNCKVFSCIGTT